MMFDWLVLTSSVPRLCPSVTCKLMFDCSVIMSCLTRLDWSSNITCKLIFDWFVHHDLSHTVGLDAYFRVANSNSVEKGTCGFVNWCWIGLCNMTYSIGIGRLLFVSFCLIPCCCFFVGLCCFFFTMYKFIYFLSVHNILFSRVMGYHF